MGVGSNTVRKNRPTPKTFSGVRLPLEIWIKQIITKTPALSKGFLGFTKVLILFIIPIGMTFGKTLTSAYARRASANVCGSVTCGKRASSSAHRSIILVRSIRLYPLTKINHSRFGKLKHSYVLPCSVVNVPENSGAFISSSANILRMSAITLSWRLLHNVAISRLDIVGACVFGRERSWCILDTCKRAGVVLAVAYR